MEHRLNPIVEASEYILRGAWLHHAAADDILCLTDTSRRNAKEACGRFWKPRGGAVPTVAVGGLMMAAHLQPASWLGLLEENSAALSNTALAAAASELRGFAASRKAGLDIVPLFVVLAGGHWATQWSPPRGPGTATGRDAQGIGRLGADIGDPGLPRRVPAGDRRRVGSPRSRMRHTSMLGNHERDLLQR
jgi:hypothetical protein